MRITNNVIMRNTKSNINTNKINVNDKNNQMSSQKKIDRPSDDPVIAVRALRLRSNLSELDQYLNKNIKEATAWQDVTDTALYNIRGLMNDMYELCEHGANDTLNQEDRRTLLTQLQQNQAQIYEEGNSDYAGRTVFTGWKTDTTLTFTQDKPEEHYTITQQLSYTDLYENTYLYNTVGTDEIVNFKTKASQLSEVSAQPASATLNRIRLAYDMIGVGTDIPGGPDTTTGNYNTLPTSIDYAKADGSYGGTIAYKTVTTAELEAAKYDLSDASLQDTDDLGNPVTYSCVLNTDTGELLFTNALSDQLKSEEAVFSFSYDKTGFEKGDLTPENYFNCTNWTKGIGDPDPVRYTYNHYDGGTWGTDSGGNPVYTKAIWQSEPVNYTIATNQEMAINLEAHDFMDQDLERDIMELTNSVQASIDAHNKLEQLENMLKQDAYAGEDDQAKLKAMIEAVNKEIDLADSNMRDVYTHYVGKFQQYYTTVDLARTDLGSRGDRLALTENRVSSQYDTVDKLKSENEDEDLSDIVIDYQAAYLAYQASLQAAAKVQQQTLLDYI